MSYFLAKTDPDTYSIDDFEREQETVWDGVRNAQAVKAILAMQPGDRVFIYHSGGVSAVVGLAEVLTAGRPDPSDPKSAIADFRLLARLDPPVTLKEIKTSGKFDDWSLVRQSRLSTMAAPTSFAAFLRKKFPQVEI